MEFLDTAEHDTTVVLVVLGMEAITWPPIASAPVESRDYFVALGNLSPKSI